jgi:DNA polymerase-3 subunit delta'
MPISDVRYQTRAQRILRRAFACGRIPHAYIFHGPDGVGKEMMARRVAKLLLCEQPVDRALAEEVVPDSGTQTVRDACDRCHSCHLSDVNNHPDMRLVYRQLAAYHEDGEVRKKKAIDIGVEVIRQFVVDVAGISSTLGRGKVFIVREADRITPQAQNALLKTLEEPPPATFLILLVNSLDRLLPTIRSRCQSVAFGPLPSEFVATRLAELAKDVAPEDARLYASLAQGSLGAALGYAEDNVAEYNGRLTQWLAELDRVNALQVAKSILDSAKDDGGRYRDRDPALSDTAAQRQALRLVFTLCATWYRDILHVLAGTRDLVANVSAMSRLDEAAGRWRLETAPVAIARVSAAEAHLASSVNVQLCIESMVFALAAMSEPGAPVPV